MEDIDELEEKLAELEREHRVLDQEIDRLVSTPPVDLLTIQRLKKKKLVLKDQIIKLKSDIVPDIIA
jgi:hypothetical protein